MLCVRLDFQLPSPRVRYAQHELRGADWILQWRRQEGAVLDEALEQETGDHRDRAECWGRIRLVLAGSLFTRRGTGLTLRANEGLASATWTSEPACALTPTCEYLDLHWRLGSGLGPGVGRGGSFRLSPRGRRRVGELVEALSLGEARRAHRAAIETLGVLRACGAPFERDAERVVLPEVSAEAHAFAHALERTVSGLSSQPMAIDLATALGVGQRQALRRANEHFRAFHLTVTTWREYMVGVRLALGAFFSSARGAQTAVVSKFVGFGSAVSFCHTLRAAGLPSPMELQRRYRDITATSTVAA
jgi:hypothetical protein